MKAVLTQLPKNALRKLPSRMGVDKRDSNHLSETESGKFGLVTRTLVQTMHNRQTLKQPR
jgi:hypothetical protein